MDNDASTQPFTLLELVSLGLSFLDRFTSRHSIPVPPEATADALGSVLPCAATDNGIPTHTPMPGVAIERTIPKDDDDRAGSRVHIRLPPVIRKEAQRLRSQSTQPELPLFSFDPNLHIGQPKHDMWGRTLHLLSHFNEQSNKKGRTDIPSPIPICHVMHDNNQLQFNRTQHSDPTVRVPNCAQGPRCAAFEIRGVEQPLQRFNTPSEEQHFQRTGFAHDGECLLCLRKRATEAMLAISQSFKPVANTNPPPMVTPFINPIDCPNGYKKDLSVEIINAPITGAFVAAFRPMLMAYTETDNGSFIDQSKLIFHPPGAESLN